VGNGWNRENMGIFDRSAAKWAAIHKKSFHKSKKRLPKLA